MTTLEIDAILEEHKDDFEAEMDKLTGGQAVLEDPGKADYWFKSPEATLPPQN